MIRKKFITKTKKTASLLLTAAIALSNANPSVLLAEDFELESEFCYEK